LRLRVLELEQVGIGGVKSFTIIIVVESLGNAISRSECAVRKDVNLDGLILEILGVKCLEFLVILEWND